MRATPLLFPAAGVAQYIRCLARELLAAGENLALFTPFRWGLDLTRAGHAVPAATTLRRSLLSAVPRPRLAARHIETALLALNSRFRGVALYHEPAALPLPYQGPIVVTVHDLSWVRYPETHPADRVATLNRLFPRALARADHVIAVSDFTRREIIEVFGVAPEKISITLEAARDGFAPRPSAECATQLSKLNLAYRGFVLSVGTLEPRKNLEAVVRAYSAMPESYRQRRPLVLVGAKGWLTSGLERELRPLVDKGHARLLGYAPDAELAALYASAHAFVYPSLYEGFGLPPLEAMASGTPAVVSSRASLPEVVGSAGIQVAPDDVEALARALQRLDEDPQHWCGLAEAGLRRSSEFSWSRCARETHAVYSKVLGLT
jgi:alpha-1,3-rhamnosyl/mannosyltransferase